MEVTGELEVKLWVSSDCVDTDFTAKLVDVHPAERRLARRLSTSTSPTASAGPASATR
jgi:predicted acyl esterase